MTANKNNEEKSKGGRPSKFDQLTELEKANIERMAKKGFTDKDMSEFLDITEQTLLNWKKAHSEFFGAVKDWKDEADYKVERSLYERAHGFTCKEDKVHVTKDGEAIITTVEKNYAPDTAACIFWLKNRKKAQWRDRIDVDAKIDATMHNMSEEDINKRLVELGVDPEILEK